MPDSAVSPRRSTCLLGDAGYTTILTPQGAGGSRWHGLAVSRWRPGAAAAQGAYVYARDLASGAYWSATPRPCGGNARCRFDDALARFARRDGTLTTTLEVAVDSPHAVELRGVGVANAGAAARRIELTSYLELALAPARADAAHPAYSKMFVQTAYADGVLLAWRRKKDPAEPDVWVAQALVVDGAEAGAREWETDRARFIGRDRTLADPLALHGALSGTVGTVLDPVLSLRAAVRVEPGATRRVAFVTAVGATRTEVLDRLHAYMSPAACVALFTAARRIAASTGAAAATALHGRPLAGALLGCERPFSGGGAAALCGEGGAPVLWAKGISGDLPIVLLPLADDRGLAQVDSLLHVQDYWRARQLPADVVVLNAVDGAAGDALAAQLAQRVAARAGGDKAQGSLFVLRAAGLDSRLRDGLYTVARIVLDATVPWPATPRTRRGGDTVVAKFVPPPAGDASAPAPPAAAVPPALDFWNGVGGFSRDGREYVTVLGPGMHTPVPWSQLVANPDFGFLVTATGGGYAWAGNSQQNQITRWSNDAVCDPPGDWFLLRDRDDGHEWSVTASPRRAAGATYVARFGPGYAGFTVTAHGVEAELLQCAAGDAPVRLSRLRLVNRSRRRRRLQVANVARWCLGAIGSDPQATTQVDVDAALGAVFARNPWRDEFTQATAFIACSAGAVHAGSHDGDGALVATVELAPGAQTAVLFLLGEGADRAAAAALVARYRRTDFAAALAATHALWDTVLQPLQVKTPEHSLDLLVNRCLPYQVLACRLWARTAFYQASGAFGFRDQLQDVGALCLTRPELARAQILLAASRQFEAGDVQHWWLPPSGKGVRTRIVDDRLWLPYIVAHYVATTGDAAVLDESVPFLHGDALQAGQTDAFFAPAAAAAGANLFEHCARAIDASLATGAHGLPLMGTGDWNDGMNRVGAGGKGESVWMGWFLCTVIRDFAPFAEARGDARVAAWRDHVQALQLALETQAWDGAWYRRAFYDDGTPLGTAADRECRIESMAQSWAVISGAGDPARAAQAMQAVRAQLVRPKDALVALFTEPFDHTPRDPGYIRGYPPGLRENGGQYTHGSIWSLIAFALQGDGAAVAELLAIFDPIRQSATAADLERYKVEPYVECADVYSVAPHVGRGGWTWYTGSAGWLYRAIVEWVLGLRVRAGRLQLEPCIPPQWRGFEIVFRRGRTGWRIEVDNPGRVCRGIARIAVDGVTLRDPAVGVALDDDGAEHRVRVTMRKESP